MDELELELIRAKAQKDRNFALIGELLSEIRRIVEEGSDGSEADESIVKACMLTVLAEWQYNKVMIELGRD